jgi:AcrR family transcriptional regulator
LSPQNLRETLISRTITVIANEGLDKTTTKAITKDTGINEAYIYRQFSDKSDMLAKTFEVLDEELVAKTMEHLPVMYMRELDYELRCRIFFSQIWKFLLGNRDKCLAFVRYYYSPYFSKYSATSHKNRYIPVVERFKEAFKQEADVWMILNHILNVMLDFAVKVHNNQMSDKDNYAEHVFRVVYASVKQYFKERDEEYAV